MDKQQILKAVNSFRGANREFSQEMGPIVEGILDLIDEGGGGGSSDVVKYTQQELTEEQQSQARTNIGGASAASVIAERDRASAAELEIMDALDGRNAETVTVLPEASASTVGKIYYVGPDSDGEYARYRGIESDGSYSFLPLGSTEIDLSDYATEEELGQLDKKISDIQTLTSAGDAAVNVPCELKQGKTYIFKNDSVEETYFALNARVTESGANTQISSALGPGASVTFVPETDFHYVRIGASYQSRAVTVTVTQTGTIDYAVKKVAEDLDVTDTKIDDVIAEKIIPFPTSIFEVEQGGLDLSTGAELNMSTRCRTRGFIYLQKEVQIILPSNIYCSYVMYYNAATKAFDSKVTKNVTNPYVTPVSGKVIRLIFTKNPNTDAIVPTDIKLYVSDVPARLASVENTTAELSEMVSQVQNVENATSGALSVACEMVARKTYLVTNTSEHGEYFAINTRETAGGDNVEQISSTLGAGSSVLFTPTTTAHYLRLTAPGGSYSGADKAGKVSVKLMSTLDGRMQTAEEQIASLEETKRVSPSVAFDFSHDLLDFDGEADVFGLTPNVNYYPNFMSQLYAKFDALVSAYPGYVSRVDLAEYLDEEYPAYASEYKTYMYIFKPTNEAINANTTKLKKALFVGGEHSAERTSSYILWCMAKALCASMNDDYFKLRNSMEIHIIPVLEGYGSIHSGADGAPQNLGRVNYNGVNINRNYPTPDWHVSGTGTADYSGETAGSEFETQLVLGVVDKEKYDMVGDYHSHIETVHVAYSDLAQTPGTDNVSKAREMYAAAADISITFKKEYPAYYGIGGDLLPMGPAPFNFNNTNGTEYYCLANRGVKAAYLNECPSVISFNNGAHAGDWHEYYTDTIFSLDEYLFRAQLLRFADWILRQEF